MWPHATRIAESRRKVCDNLHKAFKGKARAASGEVVRDILTQTERSHLVPDVAGAVHQIRAETCSFVTLGAARNILFRSRHELAVPVDDPVAGVFTLPGADGPGPH